MNSFVKLFMRLDLSIL